MSLIRPNPFLSKWAEQSLKEQESKSLKTVEVPSYDPVDSANGRANIPTGFPENTMKSVINGGVPPWGKDHNGILYKLSEANQWAQAGGLPVFDRKLCNSIGGYSLGSLVKSTRSQYSYLSYINMIDGNQNNPDSYSSPDKYWVNSSNVGNGWCILSILSDDVDSISYYTPDFRIATKVAGAKSDVYVRPSYDKVNLLPIEDSVAPFVTISDAIASIPDGGSATIHLYCNDFFSLTYDNLLTIGESLGDSLSIGARRLHFQPYGQEDWFEDFQKEAKANDSSVDPYHLQGVIRPTIYIPTNVNSFGNQIMGAIGGYYGSSIIFSGIVFEVLNSDKGQGNQIASPFNPITQFDFQGCIFNGIGILRFLYGGWGGATNNVRFTHCQMNGDGKFVQLGGGTTTLVVGGNSNDQTGLENYHYIRSNCNDYFSKTSNYDNFVMTAVSYRDKSGATPNYAPMGLQTNLTLDFS